MPTVEEILGPRPADGGFLTASGRSASPDTRSVEEILGPRPGGPARAAQAPMDPRKIDEILGPPPLHELDRRMGNLDYTPTDYEIGRYLDLKKDKGLSPSEWPGKAGGAAMALAQTAWNAAKQVPGAIADPGVGVQSIVEGGARGIRDAGDLGTKALDFILSSPLGPIGQVRRLVESPQSEKALREAEIEKFKETRRFQQQSARLASGAEMLVPEITGKANPALAEGLAIVENPINYVTAGAGAAGEGANLLGRVAGTGVVGAGKAVGLGGKLAGMALRAPGKVATAARRLVATDAELTAGEAAKIDAMVGNAATSAATAAVPEASGLMAKASALAKWADVAEQAGPAVQALGRNIAEPAWSAQVGVLKNVARDASAPDWVRRWAQAATPLDPLISAGGRAASGALHGAAVGGGLGGLTDGEEGFASGLGSGAVFGVAGGLAGGLNRGARNARIQADLTRWMDSLAPEQQAAMAGSGLSGDQAARVMNAQKFISGLGDVDFQYLTGKEWKAQGLPPARAMETSPGPRPLVRVNVDQIGNGAPVFHEIGHVLRRLFPDQIGNLDGVLFSDFVPPNGKTTDFTTGRTDTSEAILSPQRQQALYDSYFSKLDPKIQAERRANWSTAEHLASAREEIVSELLSNLLQDRKPDFLLNLSGPRRALAERLIASQEQGLLSKIPGLARDPTGSSLLAVGGQDLQTSPKMAAALRNLLKVRDRITASRTADEARSGPVGVVTQADMLGKQHAAIARVYGNSDTYAKNPNGTIKLQPDGRPVLLDEGAVRKLQAERAGVITAALTQASQGAAPIVIGDPVKGQILNPVRLQPNGESWEGHFFTDAQMTALAEVVKNRGDLLTPKQFADIARINEAIKSGNGQRFGIDHNTATKEVGHQGKRKYASQGSKFYEAVPTGFGINKKGGFYIDSFDVGNIDAKLGRWLQDPKTKGRFDLWNQDHKAVVVDILKYLDNQRNGIENSVGLERGDPIRSIQKRNLISDLIGGTSVKPPANLPGRALPDPLSTKAGRDNSVKSFRIDRINRLSDSGGENFPVDYYKVKENFMPRPVPDAGTSPLPPGVTPDAVIKHTQAQATHDLKTKLVQGGAAPALAQPMAEAAWKKAQQAVRRSGDAPSERAYAIRAADRLAQLGPADLEAIRAATIKGGTDGAAKEIEKRLLVGPTRGQRMPVRVK